MSRLLIPLVTGLLWAGSSLTHARELDVGDPVRMSLMDLARDTPAVGLPPESRLSFNRVWVDNAQARLCGLATRLDGDLLLQDGRLQMKRVQFRKRGSQWTVERAEHLAVPPNQSIETACGQRPSDTATASAPPPAAITAAIKELEAHPPTAGIPSKPGVTASVTTPIAKTVSAKADAADTVAATRTPHCDEAQPQNATSEPTGPGVVSLPGRSLLHTAPDLACRMGKHIVAGDKVTILAHMPGWTRVSYTHPLSHTTTTGWVTSDRVKPAQRSEQNVATLAR